MSDTIVIDSQSYYGLIVYDLEPEQVESFFVNADSLTNNDLVELAETGLSYLNDRIADESYSTEDDDLPHPENIKAKVHVLERMRNEYKYTEDGDYLDYEVEMVNQDGEVVLNRV